MSAPAPKRARPADEAKGAAGPWTAHKSPHPSSKLTMRKALAEGRRLYGAGTLSCSNTVVEVMAMSGFDFVVFDLEHGTGDFAYAQSGLQTLEGTGVFGCLRIAGNDPIHIKKAQGLGPDAVIVPNVDTVEQAKAAIQAFHYHPSGGKRGAGWGAERCGRWGLYKEYPYRSSIDTLLVLMIESPLGISNIEEMSRLEGFDMLIIGPRDMATNLSVYDWTKPGADQDKVLKHVALAEKKILAGGKWLGGGAVMPMSTPKEMFERGHVFCWATNDIALLRTAALGNVKAVEEATAGQKSTEKDVGDSNTTC